MLLNNHLRFTILYHRDTETDLARIVGFEVGQRFRVQSQGCPGAAAAQCGEAACCSESFMAVCDEGILLGQHRGGCLMTGLLW